MKLVPAILFLSFTVLVMACGKDKFETKPLIEVRSINTKELPQNATLKIVLDYFDKEGDLGTGAFFAEKIRLNQLPLGSSSNNSADSFFYNLPDFPPRDKGEIAFELEYSRLKESLVENDTLIFRFAVSDKEGNKADTIYTEQVVILMP